MTTIPSPTPNRLPVFTTGDWRNPAPGVWEAEASPRTVQGRAPFEAVALVAEPDTTDIGWWWCLYQPVTDDQDAPLGPLANGYAPTLAEAQRRADQAARNWRELDGADRASEPRQGA